MPVLKYLADTNVVSDYFRLGNPVKDWFARHPGEIGISTLTLAEMRRGIELKGCHHAANVARRFTASHGGRNGAAFLVPDDQNQRHMQMLHRVLDAPDHVVVQDVPGIANDE